MNGNAFLRMMREDLETEKNKVQYSEVLAVMEFVIEQNPDCEIDPGKTLDGCLSALIEAVKKNMISGKNVGMVGHEQSIAVVSEYLGLVSKGAGATPKTAGRINLEDFF